MSDKLAVQFAYDYTDKAGRNHKADATASLPRAEAKALIASGRGRVPDKQALGANASKEK